MQAQPVADQLGRILHNVRFSVTDRCNFRCDYCMPAETFGAGYKFIPRAELLTFEEIVLVARELVPLGVRTLRITGGEPLLRRGLDKLVAMLRALDSFECLDGASLDLALTTNGSLLANMAGPLRAAGLNRVTVSLDSLNPATFARMSGSRMSLDTVLNGIATASSVGFTNIKLNAVIRRGVNDSDVLELADYARANGHILRLIEFMDVGNSNGWRLDEVVPAHELLATIHTRYPVESVSATRRGEVSTRYRYVDGKGEIGLIASVSAPFCGDCTRLRLSADGTVYTCLFASTGLDLRPHLRPTYDPAGLSEALRGIWRARGDRYSELRSADSAIMRPKVEMFRLGG